MLDTDSSPASLQACDLGSVTQHAPRSGVGNTKQKPRNSLFVSGGVIQTINLSSWCRWRKMKTNALSRINFLTLFFYFCYGSWSVAVHSSISMPFYCLGSKITMLSANAIHFSSFQTFAYLFLCVTAWVKTPSTSTSDQHPCVFPQMKRMPSMLHHYI